MNIILHSNVHFQCINIHSNTVKSHALISQSTAETSTWRINKFTGRTRCKRRNCWTLKIERKISALNFHWICEFERCCSTWKLEEEGKVRFSGAAPLRTIAQSGIGVLRRNSGGTRFPRAGRVYEIIRCLIPRGWR